MVQNNPAETYLKTSEDSGPSLRPFKSSDWEIENVPIFLESLGDSKHIFHTPRMGLGVSSVALKDLWQCELIGKSHVSKVCNRACRIPTLICPGTSQTLSIEWQVPVIYLHSQHQYQYSPLQQYYLQCFSTVRDLPSFLPSFCLSVRRSFRSLQTLRSTSSGSSALYVLPVFFLYPSIDGLIAHPVYQPDQLISLHIPNQPSPEELIYA